MNTVSEDSTLFAVINSLFLSLSLSLSLRNVIESTSCVLHTHTSGYISEEQSTLCPGSEVWEICYV